MCFPAGPKVLKINHTDKIDVQLSKDCYLTSFKAVEENGKKSCFLVSLEMYFLLV